MFTIKFSKENHDDKKWKKLAFRIKIFLHEEQINREHHG